MPLARLRSGEVFEQLPQVLEVRIRATTAHPKNHLLSLVRGHFRFAYFNRDYPLNPPRAPRGGTEGREGGHGGLHS